MPPSTPYSEQLGDREPIASMRETSERIRDLVALWPAPEFERTYYALRQMNLALFAALSPAEREIPFTHPEYGALTVDWVIHQMVGHDLNHLAQLESIVVGR